MVIVDSLEALELVAENLKVKGAAGAVFAVDCEGADLPRRGQLSLLQISTHGECFVIDVLQLGHKAVSHAFKALLENPGVTKLMFDCRHESDALFHQLGIQLCNVLDLQLKEVMGRDETTEEHAKSLACLGKNVNQEPDLYEHIYHLKNLNQCLSSFGLMDRAALKRKRTVEKQVHCDPDFWLTRPLSLDAVFCAEHDVDVLFLLDARLPPVSVDALKTASLAYVNLFRDQAVPKDMFVDHGFLPLHVLPFASPESSGALQMCAGCFRQLPASTVSHSLEGQGLQCCTLCYAISLMHRNRELAGERRKSSVAKVGHGVNRRTSRRSEILL
mmetsp:Transcript_106397/g.185040  ORF Transcript_106397/g.185040 Transcript_106397/m.185040 type:complete len:330 (-) Transcript_106397:40-1029(-)